MSLWLRQPSISSNTLEDFFCFPLDFSQETWRCHVHGLYDHEGVLRFIGLDREACIAYAELFDLSLNHCSMLDLPLPLPLAVRGRPRMYPEASSS